MDCRTGLSLLEAYLDNELDRTDARELEAHIDTCADCSAALSRLDELRRSLRDQALRYAAPQSLRDRIQATADTSGALPRRSMPAWTRLAAACVLAFGAGGVSVHLWNSEQSPDTQEQIARDLFASHWRALAATSPVDVVSTDRHTVKPWFQGKLDFSPNVPDLSKEGFVLIGGRLDVMAGRQAAAIIYKRQNHVINLWISSGAGQDRALESRDLNGFHLLRWQSRGVSYWAVSDLNAAELGVFGEMIRSR